MMISVGGENLIDFVSEANRDGDALKYVAVPGGGPYNVALAAGRQGHDVTYLTPISSDALGNLLAKHLVDSKVSLAAPRVPHPTSLAIVSTDENGIPSYGFYRNGTAERQVTDEDLASWLPPETTVFHAGGLALINGDDADAWRDQFERCKRANILTSLDPNVRPALIPDRTSYIERINQLLQMADIVKLSDEDLGWLYPDHPLEEALAECRALANADLFILTLGPDGARGFAGDADVHVPSAPVKNMVDTVGAGDTFMATVLGYLLETGRVTRQSLAEMDAASIAGMLSLAARAAAMNCEHSGCNPPWRHELDLQG